MTGKRANNPDGSSFLCNSYGKASKRKIFSITIAKSTLNSILYSNSKIDLSSLNTRFTLSASFLESFPSTRQQREWKRKTAITRVKENEFESFPLLVPRRVLCETALDEWRTREWMRIFFLSERLNHPFPPFVRWKIHPHCVRSAKKRKFFYRNFPSNFALRFCCSRLFDAPPFFPIIMFCRSEERWGSSQEENWKWKKKPFSAFSKSSMSLWHFFRSFFEKLSSSLVEHWKIVRMKSSALAAKDETDWFYFSARWRWFSHFFSLLLPFRIIQMVFQFFFGKQHKTKWLFAHLHIDARPQLILTAHTVPMPMDRVGERKSFIKF